MHSSKYAYQHDRIEGVDSFNTNIQFVEKIEQGRFVNPSDILQANMKKLNASSNQFSEQNT
jgi:hypothetical protein